MYTGREDFALLKKVWEGMMPVKGYVDVWVGLTVY